MYCHGKIGPGKNSPSGPILDTKTGPARPILVNQSWSGRTSFGIQNWSGPSYTREFDAVRHCMPTEAAEKEIVDVKVPDVIQR